MGEQEAGKGEWGAGALDEGRIERGGSSGRLGSRMLEGRSEGSRRVEQKAGRQGTWVLRKSR